MEAVGAFLGAFAGTIVVSLLRRTQKKSNVQLGTGSMAKHYYTEPVKHKVVRDKYIEAEEKA